MPSRRYEALASHVRFVPRADIGAPVGYDCVWDGALVRGASPWNFPAADFYT
jgi:hypothetical protein